MKININDYRKDYANLIDRTTFPWGEDKEPHDGYILYHPNTEQWVSVTQDGEVSSFGDGDSQTKYDEDKHFRDIQWIEDYEEVEDA